MIIWNSDIRIDSEDTESTAYAAAEWLGELNNGNVSESYRIAFVRWLTASPRHIEEFLLMCDLKLKLAEILRRRSSSP